MSPIIWLTLWVSVTALALAIGASVVAHRSWLQSRSRASTALSLRVSEIESTIEGLTLNLHRLRSRVNMQKLRESTPAPTEPIDTEDDPAEIRARLNDALARKVMP